MLICEKIVHARGVIAFGRNGRDLRRLRRGYLASAVIVLDLCITCCFFAMLSIATKREVELSRLRSLLCCGYRRMRARGSTGNNGGANQAASHQPAAAAILACSKTVSYHGHRHSYHISCACGLRAFCQYRVIGHHTHNACRINQCTPYGTLLVLQTAQHAFIIVSNFCAERGRLTIV